MRKKCVFYLISLFILISFFPIQDSRQIRREDRIVSNFNIHSSLSGDVKYLIITTNIFEDSLKNLAIWKTQKGLTSQIITIDAVQQQYSGVDLEEQIKNCINDFYSNKNTEWVLLAGDNEHIPSRYAMAVETWPYDGDVVSCDSYYSDLDNNWDLNGNSDWADIGDDYDYHAEVYVGRLSANTRSEMANLVKNIINYEKIPSVGSWMTHALYSGAFLNFDQDWNGDGNPDILEGDRNRVGNFLASRLPQNWSYTTLGETEGLKPTDYPYNMTLSSENLESTINSGASIGCLMGHGNPTKMGRMIWVEDFDSDGLFDYNSTPVGYNGGTGVPIDSSGSLPLIDSATVNYSPLDEKLGMYYLVGCSNGMFDIDDDCLTEYFLKNAAIGCIGGAYVVWGEDNWTERAHGGWYAEGLCARFFEQLFQHNHPGQALALAKEDYVSDRINSGIPALYPGWEEKTLKQFNLFGDPEVPVWLNIPKSLKFSRITELNESTTSFILNATANNEIGENITITLTEKNDLIWMGKTNSSGLVEVPYSWNSLTGKVLTASKESYIPYQEIYSTPGSIPGFNPAIILIVCFIGTGIYLTKSFFLDKKRDFK